MNITIILLCALVNQVTSQANDIFPARILVLQKTISESSDLYVTCSTFGSKRHTLVYVYLCKDDLAINKKMQKQDQNDSTFIIHGVGLRHTGNYSCVYSVNDYSLSEVVKRGLNIIQILVIANFLPADISVTGPSSVSEGDDVEFRCTVSDTLQTLGGCQLIHSYLMRSESILQVQTFDVTRMEAAFAIEGAVMRDSGHYSCVVLPSKCIQEHEETLHGNNAVLLEVKGSLFIRLIVSSGVITVMLSLCLFLWCVNKPAVLSALCSPCSTSQQQANAAMLEEQQEQTEGEQEQTEGEDLEAQDGESFSMEEEGEYSMAAEDSDGFEGVYSVADEIEDDYDTIDQVCTN